MKVRITQCLAGVGYTHDVGSEVEFGNEEAERLIAKGIAEPIAATKERKAKASKKRDVETATNR